MFKKNGVWWFKIKGQMGSLETRDRSCAREKEARLRAALADGGRIRQQPDIAFKRVAERYLREKTPEKAPRSQERDIGVIGKHLVPYFGSMELRAISARHISAYRTQRLEAGVQLETAIKELNLMKAIFNVAIREWEYLDAVNPVTRVQMRPRGKGLREPMRVRYLERSEMERLLEKASDWLRPRILVARFTGMRQSNLLDLRWSHVDFAAERITLPTTKNGDRHVIPLCRAVLAVLGTLKGMYGESPYVYGEAFTAGAKQKLHREFKRTCKDAAITDYRWHDLRHQFASELAQSGIQPLQLRELLGHRDLRMTLRYAHLAPHNGHEAVKAFDRAQGDDGYHPATIKVVRG